MTLGPIAIVALLSLLGSARANLKYFEEGKSASLECLPDTGIVKYWFLHGRGSAITSLTPEHSDTYMNPNGTLVFKSVTKMHEGSHICIVEIEESVEAYSVQMDVKPLPLTNLWEAQYRGMFLTGFIAAFICLILFAGFCLVHKYRWKSPLSKVSDDHPKLVNSYTNEGMTPDEAEQCSVRM